MIKHKWLSVMALLCTFCSLSAQISDDFSDGDFSQNPVWQGDVGSFIVNSQLQLQLNAPEAGMACLSVPIGAPAPEMEWRFRIRLAFAPSANNCARLYLCSDNPVLTYDTLHGFYLQFGEAGSNDVIELFYQDEHGSQSVVRGNFDISSSFSIAVKVTCDTARLWRIYVDPQCVGIYEEDTSAFALYALPEYGYMGVQCKFSSGYRTKFYFDDFYAGPLHTDSTPPEVMAVGVAEDEPYRLRVLFSESVSEESALDMSHYQIVENDWMPVLCEFENTAQNEVALFFAEALEERQTYHLRVMAVADLAGNTMDTLDCPFSYYILHRNEVVISEMMSDPAPSVQLPECEYLELFNRLNFPIALRGWKLMLGSNVRNLPNLEIPARGYLLVVPETYLSQFSENGLVAGVSSLGIADDGQQILLCNPQGEAVFRVDFRKGWHRNALKQGGGWSLEMVDVDNPCAGSDNWDSSTDPRGGTPGAPNAIAASFPDIEPPALLRVFPEDSLHLLLVCDEPLVADSAQLRQSFQMDHGLEIVGAALVAPAYSKIRLALSEPLRHHTVYTLSQVAPLCDCVGNESLPIASFPVGLPEKAMPHDVVVNELLSNPFGDTDADFVEFYNRSDKLVDMGKMYVGSGGSELPLSVASAVPDGYLLFPQQYLAIAKNRELTAEQYLLRDIQAVVQQENLPAFPNETGVVYLLDMEYDVVDKLAYDKSMHYALLSSTDGVSLERIHFDALTQDAANWTSCAEGAGWATPGYRNSQFAELAADEEKVQVVPDLISPDGDGFHDFTEIYCHFEESENRVTIEIFNSNGLKIKTIANNQICGYEERFRWDGLTDDHRMVHNDIYIIQIQYWNLSGKRKVIRKTVAVSRRR